MIPEFIYVFFTAFLLHEVMHNFEAFRQNRYVDTYFKVDFRRLTMTAWYDGYIENPDNISYTGGLYCSLIMCAMVFFTEQAWQWSFLTMGYVQLAYGICEGLGYKKYRYIIYITIIGVMMALWIMKNYAMLW